MPVNVLRLLAAIMLGLTMVAFRAGHEISVWFMWAAGAGAWFTVDLIIRAARR